MADPEVMLEEDVQTWNSPGAPNVDRQPTPGRTSTVKADITREYISGTPDFWYTNLVRILPFAIDDVTKDFGSDLYQRLLFDPMINSAITTLKAGILESGLSLRPAVTDEDDPDYETAVELTKAIQQAFDTYDGSIDDWLWQLTDAIWQGNSLTEITHRLDSTISGKTQLVFDRFSVKPVRTYGFAVDVNRRIAGIMGLIPGVGMPVQIGNYVIDPGKQPNLLPRDKFAIYSHRPFNEDPRGSSVARPVYTPWQLKMQLLPEYAKYLKQFASPTLLGFTAPESMNIPLVDDLGNENGDQAGQMTPEEVMLNTLIKVVSGTAATFPNGSSVTPIEMHGMGNPFLFAFRWFNEEIMTGILGQSMTTMSQRNGTQALGNVQENTQATIIRQDKRAVAAVLKRDVLRQWVRYNYGEKYVRLTPIPYIGQIEEQDLAREMDSFTKAGWKLDPSQYVEVDKRLDMPMRDPDWQEKAAEIMGRQTFLQQEAWAGGAAIGQQMPAVVTQEQQQEQQAEKAANARTAEWKKAVKMASFIRQQTGISLVPDAVPPTMEEVKEVYRGHV